MIKSMHIENFKCFKDFDIELGKFNVLVGPNDSGKTSFLQAIRLAGYIGPNNSITHGRLESALGMVLGQESVWRNSPDGQITITVRGSYFGKDESEQWPVLMIQSKNGIKFQSDVQADKGTERWQQEDLERALDSGVDWRENWFSKAIGKIGYYQFEPDAMRKPSRISAKMKETGEGFPAFLAKISLESREVFFDLEKKFYSRFPYYKRLEPNITKIENDQDAFCLWFHTVRGEELSSESVSDGVMLSLAFIALAYSPKPPNILLIEEPENGVHYASLKEIVSTLKDLSDNKDVQVILTTHSPYLLDLVEPEEVRVFAKDKEGAVHAAKLSDHPEVEDLKKHFMTGEIWSGLDDVEVVEKCGGKK
ncbi:MAG: AAA family ATPase [Phycisphaerae bacterium]|nr:AAA family ATPase [Phycisphaerae bacterium]